MREQIRRFLAGVMILSLLAHDLGAVPLARFMTPASPRPMAPRALPIAMKAPETARAEAKEEKKEATAPRNAVLPAIVSALSSAASRGRKAAPRGGRACVNILQKVADAAGAPILAGLRVGGYVRVTLDDPAGNPFFELHTQALAMVQPRPVASFDFDVPAARKQAQAPIQRLAAPWERVTRNDRIHVSAAPDAVGVAEPEEAVEPEAAPEPDDNEDLDIETHFAAQTQGRRILYRTGDIMQIADRGDGRGGFQSLTLRKGSEMRTTAMLAAAAAIRTARPDGAVGSMVNVNTDASRNLDRLCGLHFQCSRGGRGELVMQYADGTRITQTYNQAAEYGSRNQYSLERPDGSRLEFSASPLVFDLDGDGVKASRKTVRYDINGDGWKDEVNDISAKDGMLSVDADKDGASGEHGRELLGDNTDLDGDGRKDGFTDGFEALHGLVTKAVKEGVLPAGPLNDRKLDGEELAKLEKAYGLRIRVGSLASRAVTLREAGVTAIFTSGLAPERVKDFDGQGNDVLKQKGAEFARADGTRGVYEDIWFSAKPRQLEALLQDPAAKVARR